MQEFPITRAATLKPKPDPKTLVFGRSFTDHMFVMNYSADKGWHDGRIVPYGPFELEPSAMVLHYAQEVFEGMKAYRTPDGGVQLFRPWRTPCASSPPVSGCASPPLIPRLWWTPSSSL